MQSAGVRLVRAYALSVHSLALCARAPHPYSPALTRPVPALREEGGRQAGRPARRAVAVHNERVWRRVRRLRRRAHVRCLRADCGLRALHFGGALWLMPQRALSRAPCGGAVLEPRSGGRGAFDAPVWGRAVARRLPRPAARQGGAELPLVQRPVACWLPPDPSSLGRSAPRRASLTPRPVVRC